MDFEAARKKLLAGLGLEIHDRRVLKAMDKVPRELFVPLASQHLSYEDIPLPIGEGQTISQPFIAALMTQELELTGKEKVLEVGTGSGYQAAILAELAGSVVSVERFSALLEGAEKLLKRLGYQSIEFHVSGRTLGWPAGAPYDAIMVTAGAPSVPEELLSQLRDGGRLVVPVGSRWDQQLLKVTRKGGQDVVKELGACRFVSLIGEGAWNG
ncbi:MAG: protein-L-isoaspartate(D-aspartate) O-methyltransferase [Dehalococcoidia bacterium]|nr:protein-L-isoaspartate(D-aspartate) O-methyltransferase [Dehalococcoidia bacterium]